MLKPAICYKNEIECALQSYFYSDDMMYYYGCLGNCSVNIANENRDGEYQFAVIDTEGKLIGYLEYTIDRYSSSAFNFHAFSFDRGNIIMAQDMYSTLEQLISTLRRIEFRAVSGNPAVKGYDCFLKRHSDIGTRHVLRDVFKDTKGFYHDYYIYEFLKNE